MTDEDRQYIANQFNAIMSVVEKMGGNLATTIAGIERRLDAIERCPAIESDIPHFERPNGGR